MLGGIGSGKTIQLLLATERLNTLEDIKAIYVDVTLYTDISDLQPGALIAIASLELLELLDEYNVYSSKQSTIEKIAYGYTEAQNVSILNSFAFGKTEIIRHKGLLHKQGTNNELIKTFLVQDKKLQK